MSRKYQVWECRVYVPANAELPSGFDGPPRIAVERALRSHGVEVIANFSGWGSAPLENEVAVIENRLPDVEAEATAPLLARIAELEKELAFINEMNDQLREQNDLVGQACAELEADAKRLDFVEGRLFGKSWNGVIDSGSRTDWRIASDYRHTTQKMVGHTFRDALDNAMKEQP
jgi:uncharacterized coiled-coil protein SlyX